MSVRKMSNVAIAMQSALATAKSITAITNASQGVVSSVGHGYQNGDFIALSVQGMSQLNDRVFRVAGIATDSYRLEDVTGGLGIDTTNAGTFFSGSAQKITFGVSLATAAQVSASGGDFSFLDTSIVHTDIDTQIPGSASAVTKEIEHLWDLADPAQIAMKKSSNLQEKIAMKFTYGKNGPIETFLGYVGYKGIPTGGRGEIIKSKAVITLSGESTYYAS